MTAVVTWDSALAEWDSPDTTWAGGSSTIAIERYQRAFIDSADQRLEVNRDVRAALATLTGALVATVFRVALDQYTRATVVDLQYPIAANIANPDPNARVDQDTRAGLVTPPGRAAISQSSRSTFDQPSHASWRE